MESFRSVRPSNQKVKFSIHPLFAAAAAAALNSVCFKSQNGNKLVDVWNVNCRKNQTHERTRLVNTYRFLFREPHTHTRKKKSDLQVKYVPQHGGKRGGFGPLLAWKTSHKWRGHFRQANRFRKPPFAAHSRVDQSAINLVVLSIRLGERERDLRDDPGLVLG